MARRKRFSAKAKARVRARTKDCCAITGVQFVADDVIEYDHIQALALGGADTEDNLQAVLVEPHKDKSRADLKVIRKADRQRKRFDGTRRPRQSIAQRKEWPTGRKIEKSMNPWPSRPLGKRHKCLPAKTHTNGDAR